MLHTKDCATALLLVFVLGLSSYKVAVLETDLLGTGLQQLDGSGAVLAEPGHAIVCSGMDIGLVW